MSAQSSTGEESVSLLAAAESRLEHEQIRNRFLLGGAARMNCNRNAAVPNRCIECETKRT